MGRVGWKAAGFVAGVAIGYATGGTGFALVQAGFMGATVGSAIGSIVDPEIIKGSQEGARLRDLSIQGSAYGGTIPWARGKVRLAGNVIWGLPIEEVATENVIESGGKGGPVSRVTQTTYSYYGTFAVAFCEGPIDNVMRIWADSKLIYDATTISLADPQYDSAGKYSQAFAAAAALGNADQISFRFYSGDETQLPDSLIVADKGADATPAYRGLCYMVFDSLPLANYGNRLPNITVELAVDEEVAHAYSDATFIPSGTTHIYSGSDFTFDPLRRRLYAWGYDDDGYVRLVMLDAKTLSELSSVRVVDLTGSNAITEFAAGAEGAVYLRSSSTMYRVDPNLWAVTSTEPASFSFGGFMRCLTIPGLRRDYHFVLEVAQQNGSAAVWSVRGDFPGQWEMIAVSGGTPAADEIWDIGSRIGPTWATTVGRVSLNYGEFYLLSGDPVLNNYPYPDIQISRIEIRVTETDEEFFFFSVYPVDIRTIAVTEIDPAASHFHDIGAFVMDAVDGDLVIAVGTGPGPGNPSARTWIFKLDRDGTLIWNTEMPFTTFGNETEASGSHLIAGTFGWRTGDATYIINTATGEYSTQSGWTAIPDVVGGSQIWSSLAGASAVTFLGHHLAKIYYERRGARVIPLSELVTDIVDRAGYAPSEIDVTDLTDDVTGWLSTQTDSAASMLTPLLAVHLADGVEEDGKLVFRHRGKSVVATIPEDDLIRLDAAGAEPYRETRIAELQLPSRLSLSFIDPTRDYQANTATWRRSRAPDPSVFSDNETTLSVGLVMDLQTALRSAERALFAAWMDRRQFAVRLSPEYAWLSPADAVTLAFSDGSTLRCRLGAAPFGADYSVDTTLFAEGGAQWTSTLTAPDIPVPVQTITDRDVTQMFLLDTPLLRDADDGGGVMMRGYWAGGYYHAGTWPGAILQDSSDGSSFNTVGALTSGAAWGYLITAPDDPVSMWRTQDASFDVGIVNGGDSLESVSDVQMLNGGNAAVLLKTNGEVEVLQFRDVTALGSGQYRLATLLRGRRGTDTMAGGHSAGQIIVFLSTSTLGAFGMPPAFQNVPAWFRAVTSGMTPPSAIKRGFTYHGRDMMPYAPVYQTATLSGSPPDIILGWTRRTRINGGLRDTIGDVPLAEETEAYEADILDAPDGTVLRTLTATTNSVTYTAAQIAIDFGSPPATINFIVYQMSATAGRGFPGIAEDLEVA